LTTDRPHLHLIQSPLGIYLRDIQRTPLLTPDEEKRLGDRIQTGDRAARDRLILANLRLVVRVARGYSRCGLGLADLIEAGNLGLLTAAERFDPSRNVPFASYALFWIKLEIRNALNNSMRAIRFPAYMVNLVRHWRRLAATLQKELGRSPTEEEVSSRLKLTRRRQERLAHVLDLQQPLSLPEGDDGEPYENTLLDSRTPPPDAALSERETMQELLERLDQLDPLVSRILSLRYGLHGQRPLTYQAIGNNLGLARSRVRQMEVQGLKRLRAVMTAC
jgi:RNA polymerase primary sigma factor